MSRAIAVSDHLSNREEQIERAAKIIGRSKNRQLVFEAIYYHKTKIKSVQEIADRTQLTRMNVLKAGGHLAKHGIVVRTKKAIKGGRSDTAYEKIDVFHACKGEILRYVENPEKLRALPTKRKPANVHVTTVRLPTAGAKVGRITIDDIDNFSKAKRLRGGGCLPITLSETVFKNGIQSIIGEKGTFKDWGGERSDLFTTRLRVGGKRLNAAFAFKGPGVRGKLVLGRMGKNGDQMPRLFQEEADVFIVQHWREIDPSILGSMNSYAVAKSYMTGRKIWYGIIDGQDSERIRTAYRNHFGSPGSVKSKSSRKRTG